MARKAQYDLYEGDGEIIGAAPRENGRGEGKEIPRRRNPADWETEEDDYAALPGKRPLGRAAAGEGPGCPGESAQKKIFSGK